MASSSLLGKVGVHLSASRSALAEATDQLTQFVFELARNQANLLGFGWTAVPDAPETYPALQAAYERSLRTGHPMPISSLHCSDVVYSEESANVAMRFWHDTSHVRLGLTFRVDDELELGLWHYQQAVELGLPPLAASLLRVDLLAQNYLVAIAKRFPLDQRTFVHRCLELGVDEAVLEEARKTA